MKTSDWPNPSEVDISGGLLHIMTVHIVSRSVARAIIEVMRNGNAWRSFLATELTTSRESPATVLSSLEELLAKGFLSAHVYHSDRHFAPTELFIHACEQQLCKLPANT